MQSPVRKMVQFDQKLLSVLKQICKDTGMEPDHVVNLALYELGRRLGHIQAASRSIPPPDGVDLLDEVEPAPPPERRSPAVKKARRPGRSAPSLPKEDILYFQADDGPLTPIRGDVFLIGRGSKCDFVIQHRSVSREHAVITRERSGWFIEDLNSANGTWLEGEQISKYRIRGGEEVQISSHNIRLTIRPG
ncbi:MAG: FHA domain-containing protein [Deltaproteobacteria bacterium]|nr:FHA domain-containing protein [Deltaproteobacteria bacterium]